MGIAGQSQDEPKQVLPSIDDEDEDLMEKPEAVADEDENLTANTEAEPRELAEDEKIAASKRDLVEFFESSSFALAMQARLLAKKPDHELNYGCVLSTLAAGSSLPRSVLEHITLVWKKDNKWIRAWLANELCDPAENETKDEIPEAEAGLLDFYALLSSEAKEAALALSEKP